MTFTQIYSDNEFFIYKSWSTNIYKYDRSYFKVTFRNVAVKSSFIFNGYVYNGYYNGEDVVIEITDIVRGIIIPQKLIFYNSNNSVLYESDILSPLSGFKKNSITEINLPNKINVNFDDYVQFSIASTNNFTVEFPEETIISKNTYLDGTVVSLTQNGAQIQINTIDVCKYLLFEWETSDGYLVNWYFLQDKLNYSSDKSLQIDTGDSDYKQYKNKKVSFSVIERMADLSTQKYLSDLVISDDVKVYIDGQWMPVSIETNNVEVHHKRKDLIFNVNFKHYDTI